MLLLLIKGARMEPITLAAVTTAVVTLAPDAAKDADPRGALLGSGGASAKEASHV